MNSLKREVTLIQQDENGFDIINDKIYQLYGVTLTKQVFVIDSYYYGVNGWTFSHTYNHHLDIDLDVLDINDDYECLLLKRNQQLTPEPKEYLK